MTKEEIFVAIRNHSGEIASSLRTLDLTIHSLVVGSKVEVEGEIDSYKGLMDFAGDKIMEIKELLDQWPELGG